MVHGAKQFQWMGLWLPFSPLATVQLQHEQGTGHLPQCDSNLSKKSRSHRNHDYIDGLLVGLQLKRSVVVVSGCVVCIVVSVLF